MSKPRSQALFALIILLLIGGAMVFAVVPPRTVSNQGSALPLFNATDYGFWIDDVQVIDDTRAANFTRWRIICRDSEST